MNAQNVLSELKRRFPNEPEYHQAVEEVLSTIEDAYNEHPEFDRYNLIERLCIPDRIFSFRVLGWTIRERYKPIWDIVYSIIMPSDRTKGGFVSIHL